MEHGIQNCESRSRNGWAGGGSGMNDASGRVFQIREQSQVSEGKRGAIDLIMDAAMKKRKKTANICRTETCSRGLRQNARNGPKRFGGTETSNQAPQRFDGVGSKLTEESGRLGQAVVTTSWLKLTEPSFCQLLDCFKYTGHQRPAVDRTFSGGLPDHFIQILHHLARHATPRFCVSSPLANAASF